MELVRGRTLHEFLHERPSLRVAGELERRLSIARSVIDAVHYAHQRGVIHRDLKPSNVIVDDELQSEVSSALHAPPVKVLDFGLARLIDHDVQATLSAGGAEIQGTLAYMSPEQTTGRVEDIDTRSDVYSLGVMLYELLCGERPYDVSNQTLVEALTTIQTKAPARMATVLGHKIDEDLETVVAKALEKDAKDRYSSAAALSEDIGRFLAQQPLQARPPSTVYQLRKLARRNRPLVFSLVATAAALLLGTVISTVLFLRAEAEAQRAARAAATSEKVAGLMSNMISGVAPSVAQGRDTELIKDILERAEASLETEVADQPEVEAELRTTIGTAYFELGEYEPAQSNLERALELRRDASEGDWRSLVESLYTLGQIHAGKGELENGEEFLREAVDRAKQAPDGASADWVGRQVALANVLVTAGRFDEAEELFEEALRARRQEPEADPAGLGIHLNSLANLLHRRGALDGAEPLYRQALEIHRSELG